MLQQNSEYIMSNDPCKILLLATLTSVLTQQSNARLGGPHFGSNSPLNGAKLQSNALGITGGGRRGDGQFGIDWY